MSFAAALKELGVSGELKPLNLKERETLYAAAFGMYEVGDYEKAANLFTQLILNEPYEVRFWKGLASSRQMQKQFKEALPAWSIVCLLNNHQPTSHFHAAECYVSMNELEEATKALTCAQLHLQEHDGPLRDKIVELKRRIDHGR